MKRIDLVCKLISPLVFAGLLSQFDSSRSGTGYTSLIMAIWCMFSFLIELFLVRRIWFSSPALWQPRILHSRNDEGETNYRQRVKTKSHKKRNYNTSNSEESQRLPESLSLSRLPGSPILKAYASFQEYTSHIVFLGRESLDLSIYFYLFYFIFSNTLNLLKNSIAFICNHIHQLDEVSFNERIYSNLFLNVLLIAFIW
jgi:hypothetical protein